MLSSVEEVKTAVSPLIGALSSKVEDPEFDGAVNQALLELRWELPVEGNKAFWVVERTKRHIYWVLLSTSADKFRYKEIFLQHRFDQYYRLVQMMDKHFQDALENDTETFDQNVYSGLIDYISTGFIYDDFGNDHTYDGWL